MPKVKKNNDDAYVAAEKTPHNYDQALEAVRKRFGPTSIISLNEDRIVPTEVISTGSYQIDRALGIGGLPRGRIVEVFGATMGGKTTLGLSTIAQAQRMGFRCGVIDAEHALDPALLRKMGVKEDLLAVSQPDYGEQGLEIVNMLTASNQFAILMVDSVAALVPRAEIEGDMDEQQMGLQARMMGKGMRKLTAIIAKTRTCVIFVNQVREKIGVMFGESSTTPGGNALKFFSSIRSDLRRIGAVKKGDENIGNRIKVTIVKNKLAPPFRSIETDLIFGRGFVPESEIVDLAVADGLIEKKGSWFSYKETILGQGKSDVMKYLRANKNFMRRLEVKLGLTKADKDGITPIDGKTVEGKIIEAKVEKKKVARA